MHLTALKKKTNTLCQSTLSNFTPFAEEQDFCCITLDYLINEQDGIGEQGGKFLKILKRAGWNKRAEGAKKIASINEQKGNPSCFNFQMKISYSFLLLCDRKVIRYLLGIVLVNY